jgi:hypothetical protein
MIKTERGNGSAAEQTQKAAAMSQPTIDARSRARFRTLLGTTSCKCPCNRIETPESSVASSKHSAIMEIT